MIEFEEYKGKLHDLHPKLDDLGQSLNIEGAKNELERYHAMQEAPGFWDDPSKSQEIVRKCRQLETKCERYEKMCATWDDLMTICEMALEEGDDSMLGELRDGYVTLEAAHGAGPPGDASDWRVRCQQRPGLLPGRRRRDGGAGLVPDALPDVHPLGGAARLYL